MEEELLRWQPAVGFPCLDADDCADSTKAAHIPDVEVHLTTLSLFIFSLSFNQISDSKKL
jgi:hypothetical protein